MLSVSDHTASSTHRNRLPLAVVFVDLLCCLSPLLAWCGSSRSVACPAIYTLSDLSMEKESNTIVLHTFYTTLSVYLATCKGASCPPSSNGLPCNRWPAKTPSRQKKNLGRDHDSCDPLTPPPLSLKRIITQNPTIPTRAKHHTLPSASPQNLSHPPQM
jgi:hypothetical protein